MPLVPQVYSRTCVALHVENHCVPINRPTDRPMSDRSTDVRPTDRLIDRQGNDTGLGTLPHPHAAKEYGNLSLGASGAVSPRFRFHHCFHSNSS